MNCKLKNSWKLFNPNSIVQSRLVLLVCAGLGWHSEDDIDAKKEDQLNELLERIWKTLVAKILTADGDGYKLDLVTKTQLEIAGKEILCPITNRLLDKIFRGYTPWIKGALTEAQVEERFTKWQDDKAGKINTKKMLERSRM